MRPELIDAATRRRLVGRFGFRVLEWCEKLPAQVDDLARKWRFQVIGPVSRGRNSCVLLCERDDGSAAVLKLTPDRDLGVAESAALVTWRDSGRVPQVFEFDDESGAFLMEAIRPGTVLADDPSRVRLGEIVGLVRDLHASTRGEAAAKFPPLLERVEFIFGFWGERLPRPEIASVIPVGLVEKSLKRARELAVRPGPSVLLHGDLHPGNVLDGARGLVALDPRPCVGDPAFDLIDWVLIGGGDESALKRRARWLAGEACVDSDQLLAWCGCTAVLVAIGRLARGENPGNVHSLLEFAVTGF